MNFESPMMKRPWAAAGIIIALLAACGGGGSSAPAPVAPTISSLSYFPNAAYVNSGGQVTVSGSFTVSAANGGVASVTVSVLDSAGATLSSTTTPIPNGKGFTSGGIQGSVVAGTGTIGTYTIRVTLTDLSGLTSNALTGSFRISAFPWVAKTPMPQAREYFGVATTGGLVYIAGGEVLNTGMTPGPASSRLDIYDPAADRWTVAANPIPTATISPTAAAFGGLIYVIGGATFASQGGDSSAVYAYDPATGTWTSKAPLPAARSDAAAAVVGSRICVFGGVSRAGSTSNPECFDPALNTWTAAAPMPTPRYGVGTATLGNLTYAVGGYDGGTNRTVEGYDASANSWSTVASLVTPREYAAVLAASGLVFAFGGDSYGAAQASIEAYDPTSGRWAIKTAMPVAMTRIGAMQIGGAVYVFEQGNTLQYTLADEIL
jgi:Kelch motif